VLVDVPLIRAIAYGREVQPIEPGAVTWGEALAAIINRSHIVTGDQIAAMVDDAVRPLGVTADVLLVDLPQRALRSIRPGQLEPVAVEGTIAGRAFQLGEILPASDEHGDQVLWLPMLDGTARAGVLRAGVAPHLLADSGLRRQLWILASLLGHLVMSKLPYSDRLHQLRDGELTEASELLWQLLPPKTFATEQVLVSAVLEPARTVAGDAYDYSVDAHVVELAVLDGVGHDIRAGQSTALALTAIRNGRRAGGLDLPALAERADQLLKAQPAPTLFVTAVLARLNTRTGLLSYLLAGHPPPLLVRHGHMVKELVHPPRPPLGVPGRGEAVGQESYEQLEPGDRLLLYSDGITEARNAQGEFFGKSRLIDFAERAESDQLSAAETLRRLAAAVLSYQGGRLQDDATLIMLDWSGTRLQRMFPTLL
jgi:hypothetical protein